MTVPPVELVMTVVCVSVVPAFSGYPILLASVKVIVALTKSLLFKVVTEDDTPILTGTDVVTPGAQKHTAAIDNQTPGGILIPWFALVEDPETLKIVLVVSGPI